MLLIGKKVILRPVNLDDLNKFHQWFNDPEIVQFLFRYRPITLMEQKKRIEALAQTDKNDSFIIEAKRKRIAIGSCSLHDIDWKDRRATFGIAIGERSYLDKGYGTEATRLIIEYGFDHMNLHRIDSSVLDSNPRSLAMHLNIGFKEEGRRRQYYFKGGAYHDEILLGILRDEWRKLKG